MKTTFKMMAGLLVVLSMIAQALPAPSYAAAPVIVVNKVSCKRVAQTLRPFILVLKRGDNLLKSITQCAQDAKLKGASFSGLGQLFDPKLAYYAKNPGVQMIDPKILNAELKGNYMVKALNGYYELVSLNGNIALYDKQYVIHAHAALTDPMFQGISGHLYGGTVGFTAEITLMPFAGPVHRLIDPKTGFGPIAVRTQH